MSHVSNVRVQTPELEALRSKGTVELSRQNITLIKLSKVDLTGKT